MHAMPISKNYGIEGSFIVEKFVQGFLQFFMMLCLEILGIW